MNVLDYLGFSEKTIPAQGNPNEHSPSKSEIISQVDEFKIDEIYFNTDQNNNSFPALFLKKVLTFDAETYQEIAEIHRKAWNYKKVVFLYVYSSTEIKIYNCTERPILRNKRDLDYEKELGNIEIETYQLTDLEQLESLNRIFSRVAIDSGVVWTIEEAKFIRDKINLQSRVDKYLVKSLVNTAEQLESEGLKIDYIHKIILRSLFLLYLEDRGATDGNFYSQIQENATSYFDILEDIHNTKDLFRRLEEHFNGNIFSLEENEEITLEQLRLIKTCFINGYEKTAQQQFFKDWRLFDFSIIQIELLSEIYENFLFKTDPVLKKQTGTYYTPPSLVEFILNQKLPIYNGEDTYSVKILDPSCGSGIFLVESFKRIVKRYENKHNKKLNDFNRLKKLLTDNIFGIELHSQAIKVAAFSLYLALVDNLNPKTIWQNQNHQLPNLINNPNDHTIKVQGKNLFCRDTILENQEIESVEFDLVVGNPPFGTTDISQSIRNYSNKYGFAKEMVLPFLHKAIRFAPTGEIVLIFNTKVLTNTGSTYKNFRKWLFNECYVEKICNFSILRNAKKNFGGQLFGDATGPISILFYQKKHPNPSDKIIYYVPKTFIKANVIEGLNIDFTDLKYLPREECQKPDTNLWKVAMWGGMSDWKLLQRLRSDYSSLTNIFLQEKIDFGVGFELSSPLNKENSEIQFLPIHTPRNITKYYTPEPTTRITADKFRRLGKVEAYQNTHVLLNEGVKVEDNKLSIFASYINYKSAYTKGLVGIYSKTNDENFLKLITVYLNSEFVKYYAFLTTSSWGIERDVVKHQELFEVPYLLEHLDQNQKNEILHLFQDEIYDKEFQTKNKKIEDKLNEIIFSRLTPTDRLAVQHLLGNIELFHKKEKSVFLHPVSQEQTVAYAELMSKEINSFLEGQDLYANAIVYNINRYTPLMMIKLSFSQERKSITLSQNEIDVELKKLDSYLWEKKSENIYIQKKLNYKTGEDVYIIRPNQKRFWSESMALEEASELVLEILNAT